MVRVVVHLPEEIHIQSMVSLLREMMDAIKMVYRIDVCLSSQELVQVLRTHIYQLALLDVQAESFAQVAAFLSRQDKTWMVLIGVKDTRDYFKYRPVMIYQNAPEYFDYAGYLYEICERLKERYQQFCIKSEYKVIGFRYDQIFCFSRNGRSIEVYTTQRKEPYRITDSIEKILDRLPRSQFIRCDQGNIVNYFYIQTLDKENRLCILRNGIRVNISRRGWPDVLEGFSLYQSRAVKFS